MMSRSRATWSGIFATTSIAEFWPVGGLSQTKYYLKDCPLWVKITRPHHPLRDQQVEVLKADKRYLVIRLPDTSTMKLPRAWTDADGAPSALALAGAEIFTIEAIRALVELVAALKNGR